MSLLLFLHRNSLRICLLIIALAVIAQWPKSLPIIHYEGQP